MPKTKIAQLNSAMRRLNIDLNSAMTKFNNHVERTFNREEDPDCDSVVTFHLPIYDTFEEVEKVSGLPVFTDRNKKGDNVMYRQITFYILNTMGYGPAEIAKHSNKDHATVIHSRKVVEDFLEIGDGKYTHNYNKVLSHLREVYQERVATINERKYVKANSSDSH